MFEGAYNLQIVVLLTVGFGLASIFGYIAWKCKVSPILGYLLAGYLIGPYSPGFVADMKMSEQLAEVGVILMMFGVGIDFRLADLIRVKKIAIPGAVGQTLVCALVSALVVYFLGWSWPAGIILGLAIGVASTVILVRMLQENRLVRTEEGHIAIGWLIVEDIITVLILLLLPTLAQVSEFSWEALLKTLGTVLGKFVLLAFILYSVGQQSVSFLLTRVSKTRSHELFTLSILALVFFIAVGTTYFFGISIALGAFIAGMVIRRTQVHEKALLHSLPMKDAFIAIFFLSVGMLFDPNILVKNFPLFLSVLAIILLVKPLTAFGICKLFKRTSGTALLVATALAQIGEFSFILSEEGMRWGFMTDEGYDAIVACALVSIAINPLIFKYLHKSAII